MLALCNYRLTVAVLGRLRDSAFLVFLAHLIGDHDSYFCPWYLTSFRPPVNTFSPKLLDGWMEKKLNLEIFWDHTLKNLDFGGATYKVSMLRHFEK